MVKTGQIRIRPVSFSSSVHPELPVEVIERSEMLKRLGHDYFETPDRPSFDALLLMRSGRGVHTVDFHPTPVVAGRLVLSRAGQVQSWDTEGDFDASIIVSRVAAAVARPWFPLDDAHRDLDPESLATAQALIDALRREQVRFAPEDAAVRLMNSLFASLCAVFERANPQVSGANLPDAYVAFLSSVETHLKRTHSVSQIADELGFSQRTINRACQKVTGKTAKSLLSERLVLEAKRLLVQTNEPAASIAQELGFSDPTNFHKFFQRNVSESPTAFRRKVRGGP